MAEIQTLPADLDETSPEVKHYERQKLVASLASLVVSLTVIPALAALMLGQGKSSAERDPPLISRNLAELLCWWEAGRLKPLVARVFPLAEAGAAMNALLARQYAGKIVLET